MTKSVGILGGGPVGLAAAAHLLARGLEPVVFEAGSTVAANVREYGHVPLFSPWRFNIDDAARALLLAEGWVEPEAEALPTAGELYRRYLVPLAETAALAPRIRLGARVEAVARASVDKVRSAKRESSPFVVRLALADGGFAEELVDAVIDTTGSWNTPNPLGANGLPVAGENLFAAQISYHIPDVAGSQRDRYAGKSTLVVGAGHSAANALLTLVELAEAEPGTQIHWVTRGKDLRRVFGGGDADGLPARGALGSRLRQAVQDGKIALRSEFRIRELRQSENRLTVVSDGSGEISGIDEIICVTGSRPDLGMTRELRLRYDPILESVDFLAPLIDPNQHSCGSVPPHGHRELSHPEANFYTAGAKSYGRAPTFLMVTGYEQVRSIAAALAGDLVAADAVHLVLPETGICSSAPGMEEESSCCATPEPSAASCCAPKVSQAASSCCAPSVKPEASCC